MLSTGRAWGADPAPSEEAKRAFNAGVILLKDPDGAKYEDALTQFNKAYRLTKSWKVLGNIGLCSLKLERDGEAIAAYEKYLSQGGRDIDVDERAQVERDLAALKAQVVDVRLELPEGSSRVLDERSPAQGAHISNEYAVAPPAARLGLHPGRHLVTLRLANGDVKWDVNLEPSASVSHRFEPIATKVASTPDVGVSSNGSRTAGFVVGGFGLVGIGVGTFFGLKTFSAKSDSESHCKGTLCDPTGVDLRDKGNGYAMISNVAFGAGIAALGVGTYLVFFHRSTGEKAGTALGVGPNVAAGRAGLELRGNW
jgi:serine/threonine-protein kinase